MRRPNAKSTPLVGKAPLGSLPAEKGQSAASSKTDYSVGDVVFCGTPTTAGEYTFIGHPKGDKDGSVLVLAHSAEIGFEVMYSTAWQFSATNHECIVAQHALMNDSPGSAVSHISGLILKTPARS